MYAQNMTVTLFIVGGLNEVHNRLAENDFRKEHVAKATDVFHRYPYAVVVEPSERFAGQPEMYTLTVCYDGAPKLTGQHLTDLSKFAKEVYGLFCPEVFQTSRPGTVNFEDGM